jgi:hypothetical protein
MRPTGPGHGVYRDSIDYSVFSGGWEVVPHECSVWQVAAASL